MNEADSTLLNRWRELSTQAFIPLQASLELTYRCNERCTHCYIEEFRDDPKRVLSTVEWKAILGQLRQAGSLYLILMGGESMLHRDFFEIASHASDLGFHVSIITNGLRIKTPETAARLAQAGVRNATISLYSMNPRLHDSMTAVRGSHALTVQAIRLCREAGIQVGVNCLLTKDNIDSYFDLAEWCIEQQMEIKADPNVTPKMNGDMSTTRLRPSEEQLLRYYREVARRWPAGVPKPCITSDDDYACNVGKGKCAVTPHGDLLVCLEVRESLGNLRERPFSELWSGPIAQKWRNIKNSDLKAEGGSCGSKSHCEHCPGIAKHEAGDALMMTAYSLKMARIKAQVASELRHAH